jgi:hypothetical protein
MLRIAGRPGPTFVLDASRDNTLGRSPEAVIVVADRLASRTHAAVRFDPITNSWMLHDLGSRNGTCLDGVPVSSAVIADGAVVRVGTSELVFKRLPPASVIPADTGGGQFVRCRPVAELEGSVLRRSSIGSTDDARRPLLLYQASIRLLASRSIREVIEAALELAAQHSGAASVGWFRVSDDIRLEPVCVVPPGSSLATRVGESMARLVARDGNAVWVAASRTPNAVPNAVPDTDPEIACVPIVERGRVHAALVASAATGSMRSADFDFLVALASLASAACAGHAGTTPGRAVPVADLGSQQTVGLDSVVMLDAEDHAAGMTIAGHAGLLEGTIAISEEHLRQLATPDGDPSPGNSRIGSFVSETGTLKLEDWQRILVVEALRRTGGSVPNAAAELGISRATLYRKLELYGLTRD